jgi:hypothetical protein
MYAFLVLGNFVGIAICLRMAAGTRYALARGMTRSPSKGNADVNPLRSA